MSEPIHIQLAQNSPPEDVADVAPETLDVFHRGAFHLVQPALKGHRSGVDAMILASAVPDRFSGHCVDLGAGAGAASFAVAARCPSARVTLVERSPFMMQFAQKTLAHPLNKDFSSRISLLEADIALSGKARIAAGLDDNAFDFAIMNPPFNEAHDRSTPDRVKAEAHVMPDDMFENWIKTAAAIVRPRGGLAIIARPGSIQPILDALNRRFGRLQLIPIHPREKAAAIRIIITGINGSRAALSMMPPLVLHESSGHRFTARAEAISNGQQSLL